MGNRKKKKASWREAERVEGNRKSKKKKGVAAGRKAASRGDEKTSVKRDEMPGVYTPKHQAKKGGD